jgi:hypothetical protein
MPRILDATGPGNGRAFAGLRSVLDSAVYGAHEGDLVDSSLQEEGKTTQCCNLAIAAQLERPEHAADRFRPAPARIGGIIRCRGQKGRSCWNIGRAVFAGQDRLPLRLQEPQRLASGWWAMPGGGTGRRNQVADLLAWAREHTIASTSTRRRWAW